MSWFVDVFKQARARKAEEFTLTELDGTQGVPDAGRALALDEDYLTIIVRSSRIVDVRRWANKYHAAVHARTHYLHQDRGDVEFQTLLAPALMRDLDSVNLDRVITIDQRVVGPVPYRGGVSLELGLFSVGDGDLAGPYIDLLKSFATASGTGFAVQALPFMAPLSQGLKLLFGDPNRSELEIGMEQTWTEMRTGTWLLMRAPAGKVDLNHLKIEPTTFHMTDEAGLPHREYPYVVLSIEATRQREDWMKIPDLKGAFDALRKAIIDPDKGDDDGRSEIKRLFTRFQTLCEWSPDLVPVDAARLVAKVRALIPLDRLARTYDPGPFEALALYE